MWPSMVLMPMAATAPSPAPVRRAAVAGTYALPTSRASTAAPDFHPTLRATLDEPGLPSPISSRDSPVSSRVSSRPLGTQPAANAPPIHSSVRPAPQRRRSRGTTRPPQAERDRPDADRDDPREEPPEHEAGDVDAVGRGGPDERQIAELGHAGAAGKRRERHEHLHHRLARDDRHDRAAPAQGVQHEDEDREHRDPVEKLEAHQLGDGAAAGAAERPRRLDELVELAVQPLGHEGASQRALHPEPD